MEQFIVSARKYRPLSFESVVGQQAITTTLQNAIRNNHLAQAFLFCGPRGVGKTTCARILAREINRNATGEEISDFSFNVFELDAASNNSVDDIRGLIEQVRIPPQTGRYKVYIIDEVHMLSAQAFNAFLKTLEEPPPHAIFILATTEKHKILPTILSRCQIFDFQRITVDAMAAHLGSIAKKENIEADPEALHIIAQKADGGLRDALSIFDQVVSFCGNKLTYEAVITNLNILDYDYYFKVTDAMLQGNIPAVMMTFNEILSRGFDGHNFLNGLASHLRNLLVATDPQTLQLVEAGSQARERYREQSARAAIPWLTAALGLLNRADIQYKSSKQPRLLVEITLMQICSLNSSQEEKKNDIPVIRSANTEGQPTENKPPLQPQSPPVNSAPAENTPAPKVSSGRTPVSRGISIKNRTEVNKDVQEKSDIQLQERPDLPFTPEALASAWQQLVELVKEEGKSQLAITLTMRPYRFTAPSLIELEIENAMQAELLKNEQMHLLDFLRTRLKNSGIRLEHVISAESAERKPYTNREKFAYLAGKHPELNLLRQQFDLDID